MSINYSGNTNGQYHELQQPGVLNGFSAFTLMMWVRSDTIGNDNGFFFGNIPAENSDQFFSFRYDDAGFSGGGNDVVKFGIQVDGNIQHNVETISNVQQAGVWQHWTARWQSGSSIELLLNAQPVALSAVVAGSPVGVTSGTDRIVVGAGTKTPRWDGLIQDVRFYSSFLSAGAIETIYNSEGLDGIVDDLYFRYWMLAEGPQGGLADELFDLSPNGLNLTSVASSGGTTTHSEESPY